MRFIISNTIQQNEIRIIKKYSVAEEVMRLNAELAQEMRETGATFTLNDLDQRFQALLRQMETECACHRGEPAPPIIPKQQWLQVQWVTIQKQTRGEEL
jgi:hypothetical protein